ncbi:extracellular catalytic domain type 1 short-chain-length polyhydroxyalkanoate depolymerase [Nostoc sp.]|uniref:extracellular catalytic domain type 1 short-chain-length polyhydroxyalkanoate depolymerase n=1 Tax=Nostoc sp. TaxID=1180 RepID=UPI002FF50D5C
MSKKYYFVLICLLSSTLAVISNSLQVEAKSVPRAKKLLNENYGRVRNQGELRTYYIYTPKSYNPKHAMSLVLVFHGDRGSGNSIAQVTRFNNLAEAFGFIAVYPNGLDHQWSFTGHLRKKIDDISFVAALIEHIERIRNINSRKIYATGFSQGGILTQALACKLPNKIAAFASVAGSLTARFVPSCHPSTSVSMMMINGTKDLNVHYNGDRMSQKEALVSIPETANFWRRHDQCTSSSEFQKLTGTKSSNRLRVKILRYSGCRNRSEVLQLAVVNGGHFWPGGASTDTKLNKLNIQLGFDASQTIWKFFQRHSLSK